MKVTAAILGEETSIHRFGYQLVAHVRKVAAQISGVIAVPIDIFNVSNLSEPEVSALFEITANRIEPPIPGIPFSTERLIPVRSGRTEQVACGGESIHFVNYVIDSCPFNIPLLLATTSIRPPAS